jgi:hypothetical protein
MGMVRMESEFGKYRYSDGYHDCKITYYLYCDECGSFGIEEYRTAGVWVKIALGLFLGGLGGLSIWHMPYSSNIMGLVGFLVLAFVVCDLFITWVIYKNETKHRCRLCGNTDITYNNILNYQEEDGSVVDVPEQLTHKHYDYTYA